jgi:GT2 family glycosyltransferase
MPTAILDVDLRQLPPALTVAPRYREALVLIRLDGRPIGLTRLKVDRGQVLAPALRDTLQRASGSLYWKQWVAGAIGASRDGYPPHPSPTCTIAVCTRERPAELVHCLAAIAQLPDDGQEVIVVDNAPRTDATFKVVGRFPGVHYVREDRPGLDAARNRALREARREIVAFTDDDARPDKGWLRALAANFEDPQVLCVTGLTMPLELETYAQEWFEQESPFGRGFTRRVFDAGNHNPLHSGPIGAGVNMAMRRSVLPQLGGFDESLDAGTPTQSGGDHEFFTRVLAAGYRVTYDPSALVWHHHRRGWKALGTTLQGYGTGVYAAWTRSLLVDREFPVLLMAWGWFRHHQLPGLIRSLLRLPRRRSLRLILAELRGCAVGPWAYLRSRRRTRSTGR